MKQIFYNGSILTCDPGLPVADSIAFENDTILAVGTGKDVLSLSDRETSVINLQGLTILPGLTDSHIHIKEFGYSLVRINCETKTKEECLQKVEKVANESTPGKWILGHGWDHNSWNGNFPTAGDLDLISPRNPVYLTGKSLHLAWVNSQALIHANINKDSVNPKGGVINRDASGIPTGILLDNAILLVDKNLPQPTLDETSHIIHLAQSQLHQFGITSLHDFDDMQTFQALNQLAINNQLRLRIWKNIPVRFIDEMLGLEWKTGQGNEWLKQGAMKLFVDGALGSKTAALLEPYEGTANDMGLVVTHPKAIVEYAHVVIPHGISLAVHAIGDRALRLALDAFEEIQQIEKSDKSSSLRHRVEHVQLIDTSDIPRFKHLNLTASMQPIHAVSDSIMAEHLWGGRCKNAYAWKTVVANGIPLIFGSDAPVESPNPFWGIHAAVTRSHRTPVSQSWCPNQCIPFDWALNAYTTAPAKAAGWQNKIGMLKTGLAADCVVFKDNPSLTPQELMYNIKPLGTMVAGSWVWKDKDLAI